MDNSGNIGSNIEAVKLVWGVYSCSSVEHQYYRYLPTE